MNKILATLILSLLFCNTGFTETYYFKECQISKKYLGNYIIDLDKNVIKRTFINIEENSYLEEIDAIELVKKNQIVAEKIQNKIHKENYFQYYLDADSKSVSIQKYKKDSEINIFRPHGPKEQINCKNVKADWTKSEKKQTNSKTGEEGKSLAEKKRQADLKRKEEKNKQADLKRKEEEEKKKNRHSISIIAKKWIKISEDSSVLEKQLKNDFNKRASKLCSLTGNFMVLEKNISVIKIGEISAFPKKGTVPGYQLGINGVVECK